LREAGEPISSSLLKMKVTTARCAGLWSQELT
jgi:hypothetical protein